MTILNRIKMLVSIMAAIIAPSAVGAPGDQFTVEGIHYEVSRDGTTVWVVNPEYGKFQFPLIDGVLTIPSQVIHNGTNYEVVGISRITNQDNLATLICPESLRFISGVSYCPKLQSINLGGATKVNGMCNLPALKEITAQLESDILIEDFYNLGLEEFATPRLVFNWMTFSDWPELRYLDLSLTEHIGQRVLYNFPKLETLILPEHITYDIGYCLFDLPALKTLTMPRFTQEGFAVIDALYDCSNLTTIYCPSETPPDIKTLTNPEDFDWPASCGNIPLTTYSSQTDDGITEDSRPEAKYAYVNIGGEHLDTDGCTVYVPRGCVEVYKTHPSWNMFKEILEYDFSSREVINTDNATPVVIVVGNSISVEGVPGFAVYDNMGRAMRHDNLQPGVYVVKPTAGDAIQVIIR